MQSTGPELLYRLEFPQLRQQLVRIGSAPALGRQLRAALRHEDQQPPHVVEGTAALLTGLLLWELKTLHVLAVLAESAVPKRLASTLP
ncbi:MAG: hypothetical protein HY332_25480 [Chloroflexi bacterium]|nr:hypothetical protein [Chloroflexota bacterium]